ncbi:MAG: TatD family hydrolase [Candidatus Micrarchaeia archaeon]
MNSGIDAHAHLGDIEEEGAIERARKELCAVVTCGYSLATSMRALEVARQNEGFVFACVGVSPQIAGRGEAWRAVLRLVDEGGVVAVGEVGLDGKYGGMARQRECFEAFIEKALQNGLPLVIHSRKAEHEVLQMLVEKGARRVLLHCFSGKLEQAVEAARRGFLFSIPPVPSKERRKIAREIPLEKLLLESDAPYLGREPTDILKSAQIIAAEKKMPLETVVAATAENARKFYGL